MNAQVAMQSVVSRKLAAAGFNVTVRKTRGDDIDAACGQLVGQVADKTRRSERYQTARQLSSV